ncbi:hypothetical protein [Microbacterium lacticum]|uniref:hypothetical protein n=1 Tax=Microbacterium lacticum TaxID=33885 RepID=UPI001F5A8B1D|nr:hypothetical protein [Microbacterium lacticum]
MTDARYREYLQALTTAETRDGALATGRARLQEARTNAVRASESRCRETTARVEDIARDLSDLDRQAKDLQRRYPVAPTPAAAPQAFDVYPDAVRSARRELDELDAADAWIRRSRQQIVDQQHRAPAQPAQTPAVHEPAPPSATPVARTSRPWHWWAAGGGVAVIGGAIILLTTLGGR